MRTRSIFSGSVRASALAALALCLPHGAAAQTSDNDWHFNLGLDLWAPTINGNLKYAVPSGGGGNPVVEIGPNNYLEHIQAVVPVFAEARKGDFSVFMELLYISLTSQASRVIGVGPTVPVDVSLNANTSSSIKGFESTLVGGYAVIRGSGGTLDLIAGARYYGFRSTTDWVLTADITGPGGGGTILTRTGSISAKADLWDGVAGVKGRVNLSKHWSLPYYADIGTGTSQLTYQLAGGVVYAWSWGSAGLVFRHLSYDMKDDKLLQNVRFSGPALTLAFHP